MIIPAEFGLAFSIDFINLQKKNGFENTWYIYSKGYQLAGYIDPRLAYSVKELAKSVTITRCQGTNPSSNFNILSYYLKHFIKEIH